MVDDLYDEVTRRRIDGVAGVAGVAGRRRPRPGPARRAIGGGALLTAVALGLQEALDPETKAVIEEIRLADETSLPAVSLLLVPDAPWQSRALVRPWLL